MDAIPFPPVANFPHDPPRLVLPVVWMTFREAVAYLDSVKSRRAKAEKHTPYWHFLGHEIKRAEIDVGLWLGRMKETADGAR